MASYVGTDKTYEGKERFYELVSTFSDAMLVTQKKDGTLRSRPMRILKAAVDDGIWFITPIDSEKITEIEDDNKVNISLQQNNRWLSISGTSRIVRDRARLDELWNDYLKLWFPNGKESGDIAFLHVIPNYGEFWDSTGVLYKLTFALEAIRARLFNVPVEDAHIQEHSKVELKTNISPETAASE